MRASAGTEVIEESQEVQEVGTLASELATAFETLVKSYQECFQLSFQEALARSEKPLPDESLQLVLKRRPMETSWHDLRNLSAKSPDLALRKWEEIKRAASDELQCGHRAARAMEGVESDCWQRAQFLAVRSELAKGWQPRNGVEWQLIDAMAQAQTAMFFWMRQLVIVSSLRAARQKREIVERGTYDLAQVSEFETVNQAGAMIDRFNKIFLRTLRALRDLRRYTPAVIVQNAGQVNVAGQQVNVTD